MKELDMAKFDEFICQFPIFEYRVLDTENVTIYERVRTICEVECERYGTTWACPPAVGTVQECEARIRSYPKAIFFSSVAEVSDVLNMKEMLATRREHENLTNEIGAFIKEQGFETLILSTESCDICEECSYLKGEPCRHPDKMHPCLESHSVMVAEIVEQEQMEYDLGGNTILWFSMILYRQ